MFKRRRQGTVIAKGSTISGDITAEGPVEVDGVIEGDLSCANLQISRHGQVNGKIKADGVLVNGKVDGPIDCANIHLQPKARVTGDIHYDTLVVEQGGYFAGRAIQKGDGQKGDGKKEKSEPQPAVKDAPIELHKKQDQTATPDTKTSRNDGQRGLG